MSEELKTKALRLFLDNRHAGILEGERGPEGWSFALRISALRSADIEPSIEVVSATLIEDIETWTQEKLALPKTAPGLRMELLLGFRASKDGHESTSFEVPSGA